MQAWRVLHQVVLLRLGVPMLILDRRCCVLFAEAVLLQERVETASMISSPSWLEKERVPEPAAASPLRHVPAQDPEQEPEEEEEEREEGGEEEDPETSSPAAKDLISSSSIGNFPLRQDDPRPSLDLGDEDLSMRLSGPSTSGTVHPNASNPGTVYLNAAPQHLDCVDDRDDPQQLETGHEIAEITSDTSDTLLLLRATSPSRDVGDVHESRSRGIKARKL